MRAWLLIAADRVVEAGPRLTELDARIGDGDHGINLGRGMSLVGEAVANEVDDETAAGLLRLSGRLLVSTVGGASGPLYGTLFLEAADAMGLGGEPTPALASALSRGADGVARRGRSAVGQKTMLDTLVPAARAFADAAAAGATAEVAAGRAVAAAQAGCEATRGMIAQRGRASYLGDRARGHLDPGAASSLLVIEALHAAVVAQPPASAGTDDSR